jgi:hypothetical protein
MAVAVLAMTVAACAMAQPADQDWMGTLHQAMPLVGHRNWVCIVDSAYPLQMSPGIETIYTGAHQADVVKAVLAEVASFKHVRPTIFLDRELTFVPEADAPGIGAYQADLKVALGGAATTPMNHEKIISMLDQAAKTFRVIILKTDLTLPYTSVFLRLDCGYWSDDAEKKMRAAMGPEEKAKKPAKPRKRPK